jgi:hypothetical protein
MISEPIIELAMRELRDALELSHGAVIPEHQIVRLIRHLLDEPELQEAMARAGDTANCLRLREAKRVVQDWSQSSHEILGRLLQLMIDDQKVLTWLHLVATKGKYGSK